ncbi:Terminase-like family [uncultured Caudovirales phage]|uniref:Terminase-like family n=1 Tax=uncultured Caudovirales phage TaxID=2100421 RepID=A0A6J5R1D4_9CAUD|nr:Terminase-like family [uncultured Caudovirales phage]CAB4187421.1 Terminase-like family [uncultured Caudovirales phage]CAB4199801.1 Terminase-like family [uncultured Caudovirales phage]
MFKIDLSRLESLSVEDRKLVESELRLVEEVRAANPLEAYVPHVKQVVFHESTDDLKVFLGGNRSGKTTAGIVDDLIQALSPGDVPDHLLGFKRWSPPFFCRVITPDLGQTLDQVILQKIREWCPPSALQGGSLDKAFDQRLRVLRFANGSWFQFMSNDQDLDKFGGAALHRIHYDEEPRQNIRKESLARLIDFGGDEVFTMTPLQGMSWMYDDVWTPFVEGRLSHATVVTVDMDDNPHLDERTKVRVLAEYSDEERQARKSGLFVHFAGLVYNEFDLDVHVVTPLESIPEGVEVFGGIDPGIRHMAAVVLCYLDAEDNLVVFDELALQGLTISEVCKEIDLRLARWDVRPRWWVIDPAARNKSNQTGRSDQMEFADHGIFTSPGQNAVRPGINKVKERLRASRIQISSECPVLISEFRKYRWSTPRRSENDAREAPVKRDDHLLDALRYVVMSRPLVPIVDVGESLSVQERMFRDSLKRLDRVVHDAGFGPGQFC